jgi:hypothetical protein
MVGGKYVFVIFESLSPVELMFVAFISSKAPGVIVLIPKLPLVSSVRPEELEELDCALNTLPLPVPEYATRKSALLPAIRALDEEIIFKIFPEEIEFEIRLRPIPLVKVDQFQFWVKLRLLIVFEAIAAVKAESPVPLPAVIQVPLIAKHPVLPEAVVRLMLPPWNVEVAVVEAKIPLVPAIAKTDPGVEVPIPRLVVIDNFEPVAFVKNKSVIVLVIDFRIEV